VLAAACVGFALGVVRGAAFPDLPRTLAVAASAFVAFDCVSLLWSSDPRAGTIELTFFILPFTALLAVAARAPWETWLPRALAATLVALASLFALIGLWQLHSHHLPYAHDLEVANSYTTYFRVTSLFKDPSLFGRHLVLAIAVLVAALWLRRVRLAVALPLVALLFAGLYFSYSQSSELTLFVVVLAITLVAADRPTRIAVAVACAVFVLIGGALVGLTAHGHSARSFTSGRTRLVSVTATVVRNHPIAGVGVGAQPLASRNEATGRREGRRKYASHATPLTVAAELGLVGIALYVAFLAAVGGLIAAAWAADAGLGLSLGAVFLALVVHSLFYSGFFEDPIMWGVPAVAAAFVAARRTHFATASKAVATGSPSAGPEPATAPSRRS
jgi:O-antigen ligase